MKNGQSSTNRCPLHLERLAALWCHPAFSRRDARAEAEQWVHPRRVRALAELLYGVCQKRAAREKRQRDCLSLPSQIWTWRERRLRERMVHEGPIPPCRGAGELYVSVRLDLPCGAEPTSECWTERGDQSSVARSYGYTVKDHYVRHHLAANSHLISVEGGVVVTCGPRREQGAQPCWYPVKSRGYSCTWRAGFLVFGKYVVRARSERSALVSVTRQRLNGQPVRHVMGG